MLICHILQSRSVHLVKIFVCLFFVLQYKLHSGGIFSVFSIGDCVIIVRRGGAEKPDMGAESKINARIGGLEVK